MRKADAKINPKNWYVNTYSLILEDIPTQTNISKSSEDFRGGFVKRIWKTKVLLRAVIAVAIKKKGMSDISAGDEELLELVTTKQRMTPEEEDLLTMYGTPEDETVVLKVCLAVDPQESTPELRKKVNLPTKKYQFFLCDRLCEGLRSQMRDLYKFCLVRQLQCSMDIGEFVTDLVSLASVAAFYHLGHKKRDKAQLRDEKHNIKVFKSMMQGLRDDVPQKVDHILIKDTETAARAFDFWIDCSIYKLNFHEFCYPELLGNKGDAVTVFADQVYNSYATELLEKTLISKCRHCGLYFRYRKGKKYCSLKIDGRNCGKKARYRRYYNRHQDEIKQKQKLK